MIPGPEQTITPRRRWIAVGVSSVVMAVSVWLIVYAFVVGAVEDAPAAPGPPFALGLALVPFAFVALVFGSRHRAAGSAVVAALLVAVPIAVVVSAVARDVVSGVAAGYASGAVVALRRDYHHSLQARMVAVVLLTTYVFALLRFIPAAGLLAGSLLPFAAVAIADSVVEWRLAERARRQEDEGEGSV
jgi:hypothetical protein